LINATLIIGIVVLVEIYFSSRWFELKTPYEQGVFELAEKRRGNWNW
jgi:hypothetical protein